MFSDQFRELFPKKIFSAGNWGYMSKYRLKNRPNHDVTKWPGGFVVMRYSALIFGEERLKHILEPHSKPYGHTRCRYCTIDWESLGKTAFLGIFGLFSLY